MASGLTTPGTLLGTTAYMSPEQAMGREADARSDQFSLGAVLFELVTGRRAFDKPTTVETLSAIVRDEAPSVRQLQPSTPPPVAWIIERCLQKDPSERYASTRDLARDLANARDRLSELTGHAETGMARPPSTDSQRGRSRRGSPRPLWRSPRWSSTTRVGVPRRARMSFASR